VGCDSLAELNLSIYPEYSVAIDTAICQGESFVSNGFTYNQTGNYSIPLQTINGCDSTLLIALTVYPIPAAPQLNSNQPECPGDALELTASGTGTATIFWQGPSGFLSNQTSFSILASKQTSGVYSAYCVENGCVSGISSISTSISFPNTFEDREFPNILTPNNDFINDDLDLKSIFQSCLSYELRILNRWGNLVYLQTNESEAFNGTTQNGSALEEGVYFYHLVYDDGAKTGFFHIMR
jgi:gliding motility-associated-like protein